MSSQNGSPEPWVTLGQADDRLRSQAWMDASEAVAEAVALLEGMEGHSGSDATPSVIVGVWPQREWPGYGLTVSSEVPRTRYMATVRWDWSGAVDSILRMIDYVLFIDPQQADEKPDAGFVFGEGSAGAALQETLYGLEGVKNGTGKRKSRSR